MQGRETSLYTISISGHLYLDESSTVSAGIYSLPFIITISPTSTWKKTGNWLMVSNKICYPFVLSIVNIYLAEFARKTVFKTLPEKPIGVRYTKPLNYLEISSVGFILTLPIHFFTLLVIVINISTFRILELKNKLIYSANAIALTVVSAKVSSEFSPESYLQIIVDQIFGQFFQVWKPTKPRH